MNDENKKVPSTPEQENFQTLQRQISKWFEGWTPEEKHRYKLGAIIVAFLLLILSRTFFFFIIYLTATLGILAMLYIYSSRIKAWYSNQSSNSKSMVGLASITVAIFWAVIGLFIIAYVPSSDKQQYKEDVIVQSTTDAEDQEEAAPPTTATTEFSPTTTTTEPPTTTTTRPPYMSKADYFASFDLEVEPKWRDGINHYRQAMRESLNETYKLAADSANRGIAKIHEAIEAHSQLKPPPEYKHGHELYGQYLQKLLQAGKQAKSAIDSEDLTRLDKAADILEEAQLLERQAADSILNNQ